MQSDARASAATGLRDRRFVVTGGRPRPHVTEWLHAFEQQWRRGERSRDQRAQAVVEPGSHRRQPLAEDQRRRDGRRLTHDREELERARPDRSDVDVPRLHRDVVAPCRPELTMPRLGPVEPSERAIKEFLHTADARATLRQRPGVSSSRSSGAARSASASSRLPRGSGCACQHRSK